MWFSMILGLSSKSPKGSKLSFRQVETASFWHLRYRGGGKFSGGENFAGKSAVKKSGQISPWRNFCSV